MPPIPARPHFLRPFPTGESSYCLFRDRPMSHLTIPHTYAAADCLLPAHPVGTLHRMGPWHASLHRQFHIGYVRFIQPHSVGAFPERGPYHASIPRHADTVLSQALPAHPVGASPRKAHATLLFPPLRSLFLPTHTGEHGSVHRVGPLSRPLIPHAHAAPGRLLPAPPVDSSPGRISCRASLHRYAHANSSNLLPPHSVGTIHGRVQAPSPHFRTPAAPPTVCYRRTQLITLLGGAHVPPPYIIMPTTAPADSYQRPQLILSPERPMTRYLTATRPRRLLPMPSVKPSL